MATPTLVKVYAPQQSAKGGRLKAGPALPPVSAYAFADIIRAADGPDLQLAIDGIAEICAKNRMSLAENSASHIQPVGVIDEVSSRRIGPQLRKPGMRRALTSVPEASSGSSEGSQPSKRRYLFGSKVRAPIKETVPRVIRIGSMGRTLTIGGTTALADTQCSIPISGRDETTGRPSAARSNSIAAASLQHLLGRANTATG